MSEESGLCSSGHPNAGLGTLILLTIPSSNESCLFHRHSTVLVPSHVYLAPTPLLTPAQSTPRTKFTIRFVALYLWSKPTKWATEIPCTPHIGKQIHHSWLTPCLPFLSRRLSSTVAPCRHDILFHRCLGSPIPTFIGPINAPSSISKP